MKWKHEPSPKYGDIRYQVKFLWFPKTIKNETRWLTTACIEQRVNQDYKWVDINWEDKDEQF